MVWIVTVNAPGYLPDNPPQDFPTWEDAREAMVGELDDTLDVMGEHGVGLQSLDILADAKPGEPWEAQIGGLVHAITAD